MVTFIDKVCGLSADASQHWEVNTVPNSRRQPEEAAPTRERAQQRLYYSPRHHKGEEEKWYPRGNWEAACSSEKKISASPFYSTLPKAKDEGGGRSPEE